VRWAALCCAIAAAVLLGAGSGKSTGAVACAKGSLAATIGGRHACLKVGQRCKPALERQYERYKFRCVSRRLRRLRPVPLTPVTIVLKPIDNSGVSGTAVLTPLAGEHMQVTLQIDNAPPGALPAHIHFDTCANPSEIRFGLTNVVNGKSETTVSGSIAYLRRGHGKFSINVHRAEPDLPIIACGDIPQG
jgi:hypothetical protein